MKPKSFPSMRFDMNSAAAEALNMRTTKYHLHVDYADHQENPHHSELSDRRPVADNPKQDEKRHREIHFAFLQKYEPLEEDEERAQAKEEKKRRKKKRVKKVKKNVGKALRATWKCLMLGLHNFALGYSTPITVAAAFSPDFHPGRTST
ncbi:uncharacterized protein V6R79_026036 [Siganus canaliculatus]